LCVGIQSGNFIVGRFPFVVTVLNAYVDAVKNLVIETGHDVINAGETSSESLIGKGMQNGGIGANAHAEWNILSLVLSAEEGGKTKN